MNQPPDADNMLSQVESAVQGLRGVAPSIDAVRKSLDKPVRASQWRRKLEATTRRYANRALADLPRITSKVEREWTANASAQIKARYETWGKTLTDALDRVRAK